MPLECHHNLTVSQLVNQLDWYQLRFLLITLARPILSSTNFCLSTRKFICGFIKTNSFFPSQTDYCVYVDCIVRKQENNKLIIQCELREEERLCVKMTKNRRSIGCGINKKGTYKMDDDKMKELWETHSDGDGENAENEYNMIANESNCLGSECGWGVYCMTYGTNEWMDVKFCDRVICSFFFSSMKKGSVCAYRWSEGHRRCT